MIVTELNEMGGAPLDGQGGTLLRVAMFAVGAGSEPPGTSGTWVSGNAFANVDGFTSTLVVYSIP